MVLIYIKPYKSLEMYKIDRLSCFVCYISIFFGVFAYDNNNGGFLLLSYIIIIGINIYFFIFLIFKVLFTFFHYENLLKFIKCIPFIKRFTKLKPKMSSKSNWRKVRRVISKYLKDKKKMMVLSMRFSTRGVAKLDEDILRQLQNHSFSEEENCLISPKDFDFETDVLDEKTGNVNNQIRNFEIHSNSIR